MKIFHVLFLVAFVATRVTGTSDYSDSDEYDEPADSSEVKQLMGLNDVDLAPIPPNETQSFFKLPILSSGSGSNTTSFSDYFGSLSDKISSALSDTVPEGVKEKLELAARILNSTIKNFETFEFKAGENATAMEKLSEIYEEGRDTLNEIERLGIPKILGDYTKTTLTALIFPESPKSSQSSESVESVSKRIAEQQQQLGSSTEEYRGESSTGLAAGTLWTVIAMIVVALVITAFIVLYLVKRHREMLKEANEQLDEEQSERLKSAE